MERAVPPPPGGSPPRPVPTASTPPMPIPPGGSPLKVDPTTLRPLPGSGVLTSLPPAPHQASLSAVEETSAGGVVVRPPGPGERGPHAAVIVRRNRAGRLEWCLPKGHLEGTETPPEAAIREVREETGLDAEIRTTLGVIDYWFSGESRRVHKVVHHYVLAMVGGHLTVEDDPDREAEDAVWVPVSDLPGRLSYPNEQRLAVVARQLLKEAPQLAVPWHESPEVGP